MCIYRNAVCKYTETNQQSRGRYENANKKKAFVVELSVFVCTASKHICRLKHLSHAVAEGMQRLKNCLGCEYHFVLVVESYVFEFNTESLHVECRSPEL